jgi:hypothetical protein
MGKFDRKCLKESSIGHEEGKIRLKMSIGEFYRTRRRETPIESVYRSVL